MPAVSIQDHIGKFLPLSTVLDKIKQTEPLDTRLITSQNKIKFTFDPIWAMSLDTIHDDAPVLAQVIIDGEEFPLTKTAALQAGAAFGIPKALAKRLPSYLLEQNLNFWYSAGMEDKSFNLLSIGKDNVISAFMKPTLKPFSNLGLLDAVLQGVYELNPDLEVYADWRFNHSLQQTDIRLVFPDASRVLSGPGTAQNDIWSHGIHITNSLTAAHQTMIDHYFVRWATGAGATIQLDSTSTWNRKAQGQAEFELFTWATQTAKELVEGSGERLDAIQSLVHLDLGSAANASDILKDINQDYRVPVAQRQSIIENLAKSEELTMYTVMQSIIDVATNPTLPADRQDSLMRIGGAIPTSTFDTVKAQVWREGHLADKTAPNPYEISNTAA